MFLLLIIWLAPPVLRMPTVVQIALQLGTFVIILLTRKIKMTTLICLFVLYSFVTLISVFVALRSFEAILKTLSMLSILLSIVMGAIDNGSNDNIIDGLFKALTSFVIFDIMTAFFIPQGLLQNIHGDPIYFSGGKFTACYVFITWLILIFMLKTNIKILYQLLLISFGAVYAYRIDCNTGLLAIVTIGIIMILSKFMTTPKSQYLWLGGFVGVNYLIVIAQIQTKIPALSFFITETLHRDIHLTGRMTIYNNIAAIMSDHWIWGYGYTSQHIMDVIGLGNMQNGFLQLVYTGGVVGGIAYTAILIHLFKLVSNIPDERIRRILLASLTAFLIVAIVEIPFTNTLFFVLTGIIEFYANKFGANKIRKIKLSF